MTFSLLGRCPRTGQLGAVVGSPAIAVGARVTHCVAGVGAVLTQHRTDPRLGSRALDLLRAGHSAQQAIEALTMGNPHAQWRQLAVLDATGTSAVYSGARTTAEMSEVVAQDACAVGNTLTTARIPPAMMVAFQADPGAPLAERLVRALEAGLAAGGASTLAHSAHLLVVEEHSFPLIDLRVDWHAAAIAELRALWLRYAPRVIDVVTRAIDPDSVTIR